MLSEYERRRLSVVQNDLDMKAVVSSLGQNAIVDYYGYVLALGSAANPLVKGVTQSGFIAIQSDAYFVLQYVSVGVNLADGSGFCNHVTWATDVDLQITDTGSGHELFNSAVPAGLICGAPHNAGSGIPYLYSIPRIIPPNTNIKIDATQIGFTALTNPAPDRFWIILNGAKVSLF